MFDNSRFCTAKTIFHYIVFVKKKKKLLGFEYLC